MKKYPKTTIRVRFPDSTMLQATFKSSERGMLRDIIWIGVLVDLGFSIQWEIYMISFNPHWKHPLASFCSVYPQDPNWLTLNWPFTRLDLHLHPMSHLYGLKRLLLVNVVWKKHNESWIGNRIDTMNYRCACSYTNLFEHDGGFAITCLFTRNIKYSK